MNPKPQVNTKQRVFISLQAAALPEPPGAPPHSAAAAHGRCSPLSADGTTPPGTALHTRTLPGPAAAASWAAKTPNSRVKTGTKEKTADKKDGSRMDQGPPWHLAMPFAHLKKSQ